MSDPDVRDLSVAFEELHAPRSTANYAHSVPSVDAVATVYPRRWPQALASVLAVLVALAGAGTFLALRNARQGGGVGSSAGYPPARSGAAVAYDSASGLTVMFGGASASGSTLADTWLWNGSSWSMWTGPSPGKMFVGPRMSDDPADGGVLLIGLPATANQGSGIACGVVGGSSGSAGSSTGSVAPGTPASVNGATPLSQPPVKSTTPVASPTPSPSSDATTACPTPVASPSLQTWLFTSKGWSHVAGSKSATFNADVPSAGSQLAYDSPSGEVIAVSTSVYPECGAPLKAGGTPQSALICPLAGTGGQSGPTTTTPCPPTTCSHSMPCRKLNTAVDTCLPFQGGMLTWTWAHGQWTQSRGAIIPSATSSVVFGDGGSPHATLLTESFTYAAPCQPAVNSCPSYTPSPQTAVYTWAGSAWNQSASVVGAPLGFSLGGATVASVGGNTVALTASGQLYLWSARNWYWAPQTEATQPDGRRDASMAEGPGGSLVLFGGVSVSTKASWVMGTGTAAGADTWVWNGSSWRHVAGSPPPSPSACSDVTGLGSNLCPRPAPLPLPAVSAPSSAAPTPSNPIGA